MNHKTETELPSGLTKTEASVVSLNIKKSFISSIDMIIIISVILSGLSSVIALVSVEGKF